MAYQTHHSTQESQQQWDEAIGKLIEQISQQNNIKTIEQAIESLKLTGGQYASESVHAMYLQKVPESQGFTRKDVSIYLAELGEDDKLLSTYFQLVHFGGLSIEDSLRLFFTELKLEALMNKNLLNVLLNGLATAFKTNGGNFNGDIEDCIRVYNAMIMLNDSLHNKNALGRSRQTEQSFLEVINERNANKVNQFGEEEMRRIYNNIQKCSLYEIKSMHTMQRTQPIEVDSDSNYNSDHNKTKSYSKYGSSTQSERNDIIPDQGKGDYNNQNHDDDPPPNGGSCCVIL